MITDARQHGIEVFKPGEFDADRHYYPRTLNAQIHPLVASFFDMSLDRLLSRYCHLNPATNQEVLRGIVTTAPKYFLWSGSDLFNVSNELGVRDKLLIETNSCPSGQKSFPLLNEIADEGGFGRLIESTFLPLVKKHVRQSKGEGAVVVLFDKNLMESSGYAQAIATLLKRDVFLVPCVEDEPEKYLRIHDRELFLLHEDKEVPVICGFRYVTQKPWTRLPFNLKTPILNPIVACLAGGRNKTSAAKAYEVFNSQFREHGLEIKTPEFQTNVRKGEVPLVVARFGGKAVVKVPYLNAGQGVFTLTNQKEIDEFMETDFGYGEFIVQQLVGNYEWSSTSSKGRHYNIGTIPNKKNEIFAFDMRMMISWQGEQYAPVAMYARRAKTPMTRELTEDSRSWDILGTNLSKSVGDNVWDTEPKRLLMMDRRDFSRLGLGLDDLIEAFFQSLMAHRAIDDMSKRLVKRGGRLNSEFLMSICNDAELVNEIRVD